VRASAYVIAIPGALSLLALAGKGIGIVPWLQRVADQWAGIVTTIPRAVGIALTRPTALMVSVVLVIACLGMLASRTSRPMVTFGSALVTLASTFMLLVAIGIVGGV
jgi:hypothetical protein